MPMNKRNVLFQRLAVVGTLVPVPFLFQFKFSHNSIGYVDLVLSYFEAFLKVVNSVPIPISVWSCSGTFRCFELFRVEKGTIEKNYKNKRIN